MGKLPPLSPPPPPHTRNPVIPLEGKFLRGSGISELQPWLITKEQEVPE